MWQLVRFFNILGLDEVGNVLIGIGLVLVTIASLVLTSLEILSLIGKAKFISAIKAGSGHSRQAMLLINRADAAYKNQYRIQAVYGLMVGIAVAAIAFGYALYHSAAHQKGMKWPQ